MPEWLVERGIGETRYARIENGSIVEARILVDGIVQAGTKLSGRLRRSGAQLVAKAGEEEYLLVGRVPGVTEGAELTFEVTRERIPGTEPWKRPLARLWAGEVSPSRLGATEREVRFPGGSNSLSNAGWDELIEEARSATVRFTGGELRIFPTPAMTLIDVDGTLPPDRLATSAATAAGRAIMRLAIGGSIGIDFPTVRGKSARAAIDDGVDQALAKPFERTSVNGFGFLQIVRPRRHASLVELAQDRASFEARALLRRLAFEPPGSKRIVTHPAVVSVIEQHARWIEQLGRQVGGAVELRGDGALPMSGGYAESL